ncbi:LysR family transcriptional regulator [Hydrocarboniphaga sp.]|uniref:LysR family transcriptional regulator n=1 Tax=Hydrocarboniphaga sp. TaxID=2033016 RepID=UPI003D0CED9A
MDLKQLRVFVMVARHGSITRAAEAMHLTQPALSLQLKALQDAVGAPLFKRTPQGMELLAAGSSLLPYAEAVLSANDAFRSAAAQVSGQVSGRLHLGTILDPDFLRLGALLGLMLQRHPAVQTDVSHGISGWVLAQLRTGALDMGFYLGQPDDERLEAAVLTPFNYRVVAPPAWQARVAGAGWNELAQLPWIWTPPESVHNRLLSAQFERVGATPRIAAQVDVEPSMLDLVKAGVGLSLVRESVAIAQARDGHVALSDMALGTELTLLCRRRDRDKPMIRAVFAVAEALWAAPASR